MHRYMGVIGHPNRYLVIGDSDFQLFDAQQIAYKTPPTPALSHRGMQKALPHWSIIHPGSKPRCKYAR